MRAILGTDRGLLRTVFATTAPHVALDGDDVSDKRHMKRRRLSFDVSAGSPDRSAAGTGAHARHLFMTRQACLSGPGNNDPDVVVRCLSALLLQAWQVDSQLALPAHGALQPLIPVPPALASPGLYPALAMHVVTASMLNFLPDDNDTDQGTGDRFGEPVASAFVSTAVMAVGDHLFAAIGALTHRKPRADARPQLFSASVAVASTMQLVHHLQPARVVRLNPAITTLIANFRALVAHADAHEPASLWGDDEGDSRVHTAVAALKLSQRFRARHEVGPRASLRQADDALDSLATRSVVELVLVLACSLLGSSTVSTVDGVESDVRRAVREAQKGTKLGGQDHPLSVYLLMRVLAFALRHSNTRCAGKRSSGRMLCCVTCSV